MYKISIIVPVFNVEDTLLDAFTSIINQTFGFNNLEVIFVDDCSSDSSWNIIKGFDDSYDNVKSIRLEENSGFAGKPRNVGIDNASSDYLMFLDPDDVFLEDACSILYNNIIDNDLDIVSGNYIKTVDGDIIENSWNILNLYDKSIEVSSINECRELLMTVPSVWTKIFKKSFILENGIDFPVGVPAQDLVFVSHCLLKANGIKFINVPVVNYLLHLDSNESVFNKRDKNVLSGYIVSYNKLLDLFYEYDEDLIWLAPRNLYFWSKKFVLTDLSLSDKIDLLRFASPLFDIFQESDKLKPQDNFGLFFEKVYDKEFIEAAKLSEILYFSYEENYGKLINKIKDKDVFLLFYGCDLEIGGLAKAVCTRAKLLDNNGYSVTLLNIDPLKNFDFIFNHYYDLEYLNKSIKFINLFEYYSNKNTLNFDYIGDNKLDLFKDSLTSIDDFLVKKEITKDYSIVLKYYNYDSKSIDLKELSNGEEFSDEFIHKEETYINGFLASVKLFDNGKLSFEEFYTCDGFKYFLINHLTKKFTLFDRISSCQISFNSINEFYDYFVTEICLKSKDKPFLINDCSGYIPDITNIDSSIAYKIGNVHSNPYYEAPYCYGSHMRNISVLNDIHSYDAIVVLTESAKLDFIKEFNFNNFYVIPNFIYESPVSNEFSVDENVISIFARISPEKNLSDLIKSFNLVLEKCDNAILKIYGRALRPFEINEKKKLDSLIEELNISDSIKFMGHTNNVYEEMSKSLATVLVSDIEGLGLVVIESMFNSTPVISYDINYGPRDIITNGVDGFLVPQYGINGLADSMVELLNNPKKAYEMGAMAQKKIFDKFSSDPVIKKWDSLFKDVYFNDILNTFNNKLKNNSKNSNLILNKNDMKDFYLDDSEKSTIIKNLKNDYIKLGMENSRLNKEISLKNIRLEYLEKYIEYNKNKKVDNSSISFKKKLLNKIIK